MSQSIKTPNNVIALPGPACRENKPTALEEWVKASTKYFEARDSFENYSAELRKATQLLRDDIFERAGQRINSTWYALGLFGDILFAEYITGHTTFDAVRVAAALIEKG